MYIFIKCHIETQKKVFNGALTKKKLQMYLYVLLSEHGSLGVCVGLPQVLICKGNIEYTKIYNYMQEFFTVILPV